MNEVNDKRAGHVHCLKVYCPTYKMTSYVNQDEGTSFRQEPVTSTDGTFASDVAGLDFEQLKLFCSILDIPGPPDSYNTQYIRE